MIVNLPVNRCALILLLTVYFILGHQSLPAQTAFSKSDSLRSVIFNASHDTVRIKALNMLAFILSTSNPDTSILLSTQALKLSEKNGLDNETGISYHQLGLFYSRMGDYNLSLESYTKALAIWQQLEKTADESQKTHYRDRKARALCNMGIINSEQGNYSKAMDYYFKALKTFEVLKSEREIAVIHINLGIIYKEHKNYSKALENFYRSLKIMEQLSDKYSTAIVLINIGIVYDNQGDSALAAGDTVIALSELNGTPQGKYPKALECYFKALKMHEEINNIAGVANTLGNIGVAYDDQGNASSVDSIKKKYFSKALDYDFRAVKIFTELGTQRDIALNFCNIGSIYLKLKNFKEAEKYLQNAIGISDTIGVLTVSSEAENMLSSLYEQTHQTAKAFEHYKKYIIKRDSIFNEENLKKQTRSEMNYEFDKKAAKAKAEAEKKEAVAATESRRQRLFLWLIASVAVAVAVIAVVVFRSLQVSNRQKKIIAQKNKEITDSINYAVRIQNAKLPRKEEIFKALPQSFILYKPKDIVSGDFYWISAVESEKVGHGESEKDTHTRTLSHFPTFSPSVIFAAADCTGHGIPGAFMSMICSEKLNDAVKIHNKPGDILSFVNKDLRASLHQSVNPDSTRDGMDIALVCLTPVPSPIGEGSWKLQYAGANRPLWIIRKSPLPLGGERGGLLDEIKATKKAIGGFTEDNQVFETHEIQLRKGDVFYIFSDGYADQSGGDKKKKLMTKTFKQILLEIQDKTMAEQEQYLDKYFENWCGNCEQVDDILVIGVKL